MHSHIIGIDEVGRGPIAGPIVVGAVCIPSSITWENVPTLKDSKKLTEKKREEWYRWVVAQVDIHWAIAEVSAERIDIIGITAAGNEAARSALQKLMRSPKTTKVLLDYGLRVGDEWPQTALIKGDEKEVAIALASIMAKVTRDKYMMHMAEQYPSYGFAQHKGYGTKMHYESIKKNGLCTLHRRCFLKGLH
ncbi:MAG: ribonuclease HII [Minisyncoccia bacterium]